MVSLLEDRRRILLNTPHVEEVSDGIASFETDVPAKLKKCLVGIDPIQDLHGYDYPWPPGGGKNKFNVGALSNTDDITISDGNIIVKGVSKNSGKKLKEIADLVVGETYILTATTTGTNSFIYLYGTNNSWSFTKQRTVTQQDLDSIVFFYGMADESVSITISNMMIRLSTVTDATYAPYSNICPISGRTEMKVGKRGKNLWDEQWEAGTLKYSTGELVSSGVTMRSKNYIAIKPGEKYIAIGPYNVISTNQFIVCYYDKNHDYVTYETINKPEMFTVPDNDEIMYMLFAYRYYLNDSGGTYKNDVAINFPFTAASYEPYTGETYDITFPSEASTVYGGTLDMLTGVLTVDRAIVKISDLSWNYDTSWLRFNGNGIEEVCKKPESNSVTLPGLASSVYKASSAASTGSLAINGTIGVLVSGVVCIRDESYSNEEEWLNFIGNEPIVYPLANPITYQLDPHTLKAIRGINNIWSDTGDTTVRFWTH